MNFDLNEEQQMLQDSIRRFLRESVTSDMPLHATEDPRGHSRDIWDGLAELGVAGALFSEESGGFGGSGFDILVVFEELGRAGVFEPLLESGVLAGGLIDLLGTSYQKTLVGEIIGGRIVALAHAERGGRYNLSHVSTQATSTDGGWTLSGAKSLVMAAPSADLAVVSARTSGSLSDEAGISLFLMPLDAEGLHLRSYQLAGGGRAAELVLNDVFLADNQALGDIGGAFGALEAVHARAVAAQCAEALGLMERIKEITVEYLRTRKQFGRPIGSFQALQHRMADVLTEIEQVRSATINVCGHLNVARVDRERYVSAAKNLVGRVSRLVAEESIQMHGAIGMTMEYALGHLAKRLTMVDHRFGDADWHLERFIRLSSEKNGN
jgi:alkylation response protein AidB-like acyl-CoA dehydrogenase